MSEPDKGPNRTTEYLANERTFLAWLRTCTALMGLGFVVARFSLFLQEFGIITKTQPHQSVLPMHFSSTLLGMAMIGLGIVLMVYSLANYSRAQKEIEAGTVRPNLSVAFLASIGLAAFGVVVIIYLVSISL